MSRRQQFQKRARCPLLRTAGLLGAYSFSAGLASAQVPPPAPAWSEAGPSLHVQLSSSQGLPLKMRPAPVEGLAPPAFVACPPSCRLVIYPGRYQVVAEPPPGSDLRLVVKSVELWNDADVEVTAGNQSDHRLGIGLTIAGSIVLGLGLVFYTLTHESGSDPDTATNVATLGAMAVGAPLTAGGIYFLVRGRNRINIETPWQTSTAPNVSLSGIQIDAGWPF